MDQKFSGEVGQVAGRDVKNSGAQASVSIHLHNGEGAKRCISDRQRRAIGAKVFELEAKTGVEKLIVYRRLMTRFKFQTMDEMPRDLFERVMRYLDGWIRNGSAEQVSPAPAQPEVKEPTPATPQPIALAESPADPPAPQVVAATTAKAEPVPAQQQKARLPWLAVSIAVVATAGVAAALYTVTHRPDESAQDQAAVTSPHCEYGGNRYSLGSVVMQAGVRRQCAAVDDGAAWERVDTSRR
ncbi:alpha/beta hydrolase [Burkholderia ambifaria]|uniref:alpha/beta hydrolase n=1 Tax=Burkholderia ambifaria TaxID=152480 RepID=UPI001E3E04B1|nr:alpha/beta hydrolase [Burkholderia ambifaria]UEP52050.1 alpha/beta hydrolase [Burkholderia ambifaria]